MDLELSNRAYSQRSPTTYIPGQLVIKSSKNLSGKYTHRVYICTPNGNLSQLHTQISFFPLPPAVNYEYEETE